MTISYSGNFARLLLRWKASIWKTVWKELLVFALLYAIIRVFYQTALEGYWKLVFETLVVEFDKYTERMPIMFLLGFYVNAVVKRWWEQFEWLGWPDDVVSSICYLMPHDDDLSKQRRRTVARYVNLTAALSWREISVRVRKRFPSLEHLVDAGLLTAGELAIFKANPASTRWFTPLQWSQQIIQDYCRENETPPPIVAQCLDYINKYRLGFRKLHCYDWVCIPLVYTQVAAIATYGYFAMCLIGRQFLDKKNINIEDCEINCVDYRVPFFTILEFLCYIGWFKVGQDLMRPFEEDDDDFELNYILDRHVLTTAAMVNTVCAERPPMAEGEPAWDKADAILHCHTRLSSRQAYHPPKLHAWVTSHNDEDFKAHDAALPLFESNPRRKRWRYF